MNKYKINFLDLCKVYQSNKTFALFNIKNNTRQKYKKYFFQNKTLQKYKKYFFQNKTLVIMKLFGTNLRKLFH